MFRKNVSHFTITAIGAGSYKKGCGCEGGLLKTKQKKAVVMAMSSDILVYFYIQRVLKMEIQRRSTDC